MRARARLSRSLPFALLLLAACSEPTATSPPSPAEPRTTPAAVEADWLATAQARGFDPQRVRRGGALYQQYCAACHGPRAEGAPNWHRRGPDGRFPPPPLDGTGHAWHHPRAALARTIRDGTERLGGSMPAWGDRLSEADIEAIIAWFQSSWPEEIYRNWLELDRKARAAGS